MKTKIREKANWPVTILLILGLITVVFPLYMTIVIAFKQPTEMTNSVAGILSLPEKFSLANFREAMEVTDFWQQQKILSHRLSWELRKYFFHTDHWKRFPIILFLWLRKQMFR